MKFKIIEKSRVIEQTIEFVFEYEGIKYIGKKNDNGNGNTMWLRYEESIKKQHNESILNPKS